jgi:hypothetical protein
MLRKNGVAVGDRGFCSHKLFKQFIQNGALFIIRIKSNWKWDENYRIATRYGPVRVVCFGIAKHTKVGMIWVVGRSPTLVSYSLRGVAMNLKATTLTYLAIALKRKWTTTWLRIFLRQS